MSIKNIVVIPIRVVLAAYCFLQFAVQVLWLGKWRMPREVKKMRGRSNSRRAIMLIAHRHVVRYLDTLEFLGLVKFRFEGAPYTQPCIVVANHPSLLDFIAMLRDLPNAVCVYKSRSLDNQVLSPFIQAAGYIEGMDATVGAGRRIVSECRDRLAEGHHVVIFPEGTRSESATSARKFRLAAFQVAVKHTVPVQPVVILCQPLFLGKNQRWIESSQHINTMTIRYLPVMHVEELPECRQTASGFAKAARENILDALRKMAGSTSTRHL
jgi:1-acyl-sn-glycerol-3-phosphate acyltransferase